MSYLGIQPGPYTVDYQTGFRYTITGTTTSITGTDDNGRTLAYTAGFIEVWVNGVKWANVLDYTATNGTSITLTSAVIAGDIVEVFAHSPYGFTLSANTITSYNRALSSYGYNDVMINGKFEITAASSALTISLKTLAGTDPTSIDPVDIIFRNVTGTTGDIARLRIEAATSFTVSSGSTLNVTSSTAFRIWIVGFNDAGTFRLGVYRTWTTEGLGDVLYDGIASSTAEGGAGAADSAGVIYTGTAVTSKAMRILGFAEWGTSGVTAGTWTTTNLAKVQLMGPGVPYPGTIVQRKVQTTATATTTTSTTYVSTNSVISFTLKSPANLCRAHAVGNLFGSESGNQPQAKLHYNNGTAMGTSANFYNNPASCGTQVYIEGWALPNTTSASQFDVRIKSPTAGTVGWAQNSQQDIGMIITVEEYMI